MNSIKQIKIRDRSATVQPRPTDSDLQDGANRLSAVLGEAPSAQGSR